MGELVEVTPGVYGWTDQRAARQVGLNASELDVLLLMALGASNDVIAERMQITTDDVKTRLRSMARRRIPADGRHTMRAAALAAGLVHLTTGHEQADHPGAPQATTTTEADPFRVTVRNDLCRTHDIPAAVRAVLAYVVVGMDNRAIARAVYRSVDTVKTHVVRAGRLTGHHGRGQLTAWAVGSGIADVRWMGEPSGNLPALPPAGEQGPPPARHLPVRGARVNVNAAVAVHALSAREGRVLALLTAGASDAGIAARIGRSEATVAGDLRHLMTCTQVHGVEAIVPRLAESGYVTVRGPDGACGFTPTADDMSVAAGGLAVTISASRCRDLGVVGDTRKVLALTVAGLDTGQVSGILHLSQPAVRAHQRLLHHTTGTATGRQLTTWALAHGLADTRRAPSTS